MHIFGKNSGTELREEASIVPLVEPPLSHQNATLFFSQGERTPCSPLVCLSFLFSLVLMASLLASPSWAQTPSAEAPLSNSPSLGLQATSSSLEPVMVSGQEKGLRMNGKFEIWHDPKAKATLLDAQQALVEGAFSPLETKGSTGLKPGAIWSHFYIKNIHAEAVTLHVEYVDHQLIALDAYQRSVHENSHPSFFSVIANMGLFNPFHQRDISHNRFVFSATIEANSTSEFLVKFSSDQQGFVFPNLRIWSPNALRHSQALETSTIAFFLGGFFLMSVFAFVGGVTTGEKSFNAYSVYALSKVILWATILGYSHQFVITESFHWSYMSLSGAISIFCGLWFARTFLQTREFIPRLDYILILMMANAVFLFFCALYKLTALTVISITCALLLYPILSIAGIIRWCQGSRDAAVFAFAWSFLVVGLVVQALRDLGFVSHNYFNYYWPPFASYTEMVVIMAAMGMKVKRLRRQKDDAETKYTRQLVQSKTELERQVSERTRDLEEAKLIAEREASTDSLTGIPNRRSFLAKSESTIDIMNNTGLPLSLIMFDIDHFKTINDTYGHNVGDEALCAFASTIQRHIRDDDIFGRLGGEEFSLLVQVDREVALHTAERLRVDIENIILKAGNEALRYTTSVGVAHWREKELIDELLSRADEALYEAKASGRNRVVEADTGIS